MAEGRIHSVVTGDCISSIAFEHGFFPDTVWNHPENEQLRTLREDPNVLREGDAVFVPEKTLREEDCQTEQRHTFRRKGVPSELNVQFMFDGDRAENVPYTLVIDGSSFTGTTDKQGYVRQAIPPNAQTGTITLRPKDREPAVFELQLGHLDPLDTVKGQKGRLTNLGFYAGPLDDDESEAFKAAVRAFQRSKELEDSGEVDQATLDQLKSIHSS